MSMISIILALASTLTSAISAYLVSENSLIWQISLGLAVVFYGVYLYLERRFFLEVFSRKTTQYGINAVLVSVIGFGILVFVNLIATKYDIKKDLQKTNFTLSPTNR